MFPKIHTVAILAKRGQCTYETKARVASTLTSPHGTVRFVLVYDNLPEDGNHLITMMPKDESSMGRKISGGGGHDLWGDVGLVFVSYESGVGEFFYLFCLLFVIYSWFIGLLLYCAHNVYAYTCARMMCNV